MKQNVDQKVQKLINSKPVQDILSSVNSLRANGKIIYPENEDIFKSLLLCPLSQTRVVIFGQDPYHQPNVADGLAFSTKQTKTPASLLNIFKEIKNEYPNIQFKSNNLSSWATQGVLLLNTTLTVEQFQPLSHQNLGWNCFIDALIEIINQDLENVIFVLWGNKAKQLISKINVDKHMILVSAHPSPLSQGKFFNNGHFKEINKILKSLNQPEIDWSTK